MDFDHREVLQHCVDAFNTYRADTTPLDVHLDQYIRQNRLNEEIGEFITEVISDMVRYNDVLDVVITGFYNKDGKSVLRSESTLYKAITYFALFRMDELEMDHFRNLVKSQDANRMHRFLKFFLNEKYLLTWMKDEWCQLYEEKFVQNNLITPIIKWLPQLRELLQKLQLKVDNKVQSKKSSEVKSIESKPFQLTQPKPRSIPAPSPIPKLQHHRSVPRSIYATPKEQVSLSTKKLENKGKAEKLLEEATASQFSCAVVEKSEKTKEKIRQIMEEEESKYDFERRHKTSEPPKETSTIPIKLNTAAILREGKHVQKVEEELLKKLEKLEAGAFDDSDFTKWQTEIRQKDFQERLADIERRRLEGKLSYEQAIYARKIVMQENRERAEEVKNEARHLMDEYLKERLKEEDEMRKIVQDVQDVHENAKIAKEKMKEYKQKIVQEMNEASKELMRQALEEAEEEMRRKLELINQIRVMEAVPIVRQKFVDLTETAGFGFLSEMSIAELKERLSIMHDMEQKELDERRDQIVGQKQAKTQMITETLEVIARHRAEKTKVAAKRLEDRKKQRQGIVETKPAVADDRLTELQRKIEERRSERLRESEREKEAYKKASGAKIRKFTAEERRQLERERLKEVEKARETSAEAAAQGLKTVESRLQQKLLAT